MLKPLLMAVARGGVLVEEVPEWGWGLVQSDHWVGEPLLSDLSFLVLEVCLAWWMASGCQVACGSLVGIWAGPLCDRLVVWLEKLMLHSTSWPLLLGFLSSQLLQAIPCPWNVPFWISSLPICWEWSCLEICLVWLRLRAFVATAVAPVAESVFEPGTVPMAWAGVGPVLEPLWVSEC